MNIDNLNLIFPKVSNFNISNNKTIQNGLSCSNISGYLNKDVDDEFDFLEDNNIVNDEPYEFVDEKGIPNDEDFNITTSIFDLLPKDI